MIEGDIFKTLNFFWNKLCHVHDMISHAHDILAHANDIISQI